MDEIIQKIDDLFDFFANLFSGIGILTEELLETILSVLSMALTPVMEFVYNLLFNELWSTCRSYGRKFLNFFFGTFCSQTFSFQAIEYIIGFIFVIFVVKLTVRLVRG